MSCPTCGCNRPAFEVEGQCALVPVLLDALQACADYFENNPEAASITLNDRISDALKAAEER